MDSLLVWEQKCCLVESVAVPEASVAVRVDVVVRVGAGVGSRCGWTGSVSVGRR